jgi:hypothetical protein
MHVYLCTWGLASSHEDVWGVEVKLLTFLILEHFGSESSASFSEKFVIRERDLRTLYVGGSMGPRRDLDRMMKRKYPCSCQARIKPWFSSP